MADKYNPKNHHRRSIRLPDYDYSQEGWYYVTLCVLGNKCIFGKLTDGQVQLYQYGRIVEDCWKWLAKQYTYVHLDEYVVMPNHLHGIIIIRRDHKGGSRTAPTGNMTKYKSLSRLVGAFKTVSTNQVNIIRNTPGRKLWQRNYYEHIIRNEEELSHIRHYITENPVDWRKNEENPKLQPK